MKHRQKICDYDLLKQELRTIIRKHHSVLSARDMEALENAIMVVATLEMISQSQEPNDEFH